MNKKIRIIAISTILAVIVVCAIVMFYNLNNTLNWQQDNLLKLNVDERQGDNFNTLLLGLDEQDRVDTIVLMMLSENGIKELSIPRNTLFEGKTISDIISMENGDQKVIDVIRNDLSVPITYYAKVKIDVIKDLIDNTGGEIAVDIPMDMKYDDPYKNLHIDLKKCQNQKLNGESICELLRYRRSNDGTGYSDGDLGRIKIGQQVMMSFLQQNNSIEIISNSQAIIDSLNTNVTTNYPFKNCIKDTKLLKNRMFSYEIVPGKVVVSEDGISNYEIDYDKLKYILTGNV